MPLRTNPRYLSMEAGQWLLFGFLQFLLVQSTQFHWYIIPSNSCFSIFLSSNLHCSASLLLDHVFAYNPHKILLSNSYLQFTSFLPILKLFDTYSPSIFLSASEDPGVGRTWIYRVVCLPLSTLQGKLRF